MLFRLNMMKSILVLLALLSSQAFAVGSPELIVKTQQGLVQGKKADDVISFKGIPFALPPVGELRWAPTVPGKSWTGIKEASNFGSPCMQTENMDADGKVIGSEDCLTLNIFKPATAKKNLPVMVFIYGGAFSWGDSSGHLGDRNLYDGTYLSSHGDTVVVTFNYRLGAFGFLTHPALRKNGLSGNYGLMDQITALKWVQQNIASFGGDPSRVMIFGESAGAFSVLGLITSPEAKGLFSRALLESGSDIRHNLETAEKVGGDFTISAKCSDATDIAACLRALDKNEVMRITSTFLHGKGAQLVFAPYVDGKIIPDYPIRSLQSGNYNHVPVVIGTNSDEMTVLGLPIIKEKPFFARKDYEEMVNQEFGAELGKKIIDFYGAPVDKTSFGLLSDVVADNIFHCPTQQIAEILSINQPGQVWRYLFTHAFHLDFARVLGAGHALELAYVFHNFAPWYSVKAPNYSELELSDQIGGYWTRFAATGNPNGGRALEWPAYARDAKYLELETPIAERSGFRNEACEFWRRVMP
jgi:para-nitrobenzyl esterase